MKTKQFIPGILIICLSLFLFQCDKETILIQGDDTIDPVFNAKGGGGKPGGETAGNNLSFPVIWAEGVAKVLPGTPGADPLLGGEWWYWWGTEGTDPNIVPLSCPPDPDDPTRCDDGVPGVANGEIPGEGYEEDLVKAFVQKDQYNVWQAESWPPVGGVPSADVNVDLIDWGDNLESVDWYTRSQVRAEVVLFEGSGIGDLEEHVWPMLEYEMRHTSGWGINEVHGLAANVSDNEAFLGEGIEATVYSPCARLTIQKLNVDRDDVRLTDLTWEAEEGWIEPDEYPDDLINEPIFNMAVHEAADGPGYYNAEINVKGRIIYGYTWNVRKLNEGAGDYRLTFSFDTKAGGAGPELNTFFEEDITQIKVPVEEEVLMAIAEAESEPGGGATAVLVPAVRDDEGNLIGGNLTYMDVRILDRSGGGNGGGGGSGKGGGGGNGGGNPN